MSKGHRGRCTGCRKDRLLDGHHLCQTCSTGSLAEDDTESPNVLRGRWVPNGRGTLSYVDGLAS